MLWCPTGRQRGLGWTFCIRMILVSALLLQCGVGRRRTKEEEGGLHAALTKVGQHQAHETGVAISKMELHRPLIVASPFLRTMQTAAAVRTRRANTTTHQDKDTD